MEKLEGGVAMFPGNDVVAVLPLLPAEADTFLGNVAGIVILGFSWGAAAGPEVLHPGGFKEGGLHGADDLAQPDMGHGVFAEKKIGSPQFPTGPAKVLDLIHTKNMAGIPST